MPSGSSPKPWTQFTARTVFIRVPVEDWAEVKLGTKTEFRQPGANARLQQVKCPTPVVAYALPRGGQPRASLMLLERTWREMLGNISDESLEREGFPDIAHFRRYWMQRRKARFRPGDEVQVFRVRPCDDYDYMGRLLLARLYGEHVQ